MNLLAKKQLNLLVHLAKADGRFDRTERDLLNSFIQEKGLDRSAISENGPLPSWSDFVQYENKIELLYWALKMMHADKVVHEKEIAFCKEVAFKLGLNDNIVRYYTKPPLPTFEVFEKEIENL